VFVSHLGHMQELNADGELTFLWGLELTVDSPTGVMLSDGYHIWAGDGEIVCIVCS
jgi:hypothetical protein